VTQKSGIAAVAETAGVSVSTVSQVLSGNRPVSDATRARVNAAIAELGYTPHPGARSLRSRRTESIALLVPDITNPFYPLVAVGMQDVLLPAGYLLSILDAGSQSGTGRLLGHVLERRFDGIALHIDGLSDSDRARLADSGTRVVALGRDIGIEGSDYVESDDAGGFAKLGEHLLATGRRRIGFIGGEAESDPSRLRLGGLRQAFAAAGTEFADAATVFTSFTRDGGRDGVEALYARRDDWDAIVCANDLIAIGAMDELRRRGLSIPDDVAVSGYDDIDAAALVHPSLTTVENPAREIGRTAARLLLTRLAGDGDDAPTQHITLSTRLVVRDSTTSPIPQER